MNRFEYYHIVSFEETNLVGNVYFANHLKWQGRCREFFLKEKVPDLLARLENGSLALITLHCSCDYFGELKAFDEIKICMYLDGIQQNRVKMLFEYYKTSGEKEALVAKGRHEIGCYARQGQTLEPIAIPEGLREALEVYSR